MALEFPGMQNQNLSLEKCQATLLNSQHLIINLVPLAGFYWLQATAITRRKHLSFRMGGHELFLPVNQVRAVLKRATERISLTKNCLPTISYFSPRHAVEVVGIPISGRQADSGFGFF